MSAVNGSVGTSLVRGAITMVVTEPPACGTASTSCDIGAAIVWRSAGRYRGEGRLIAWLLGIVHHLALKTLHRRSIPLSDELEENLPAPIGSLDAQAQARQQARWVHDGLQSLSPEHRAVLELVFYQGLSLAEAAQVSGCPPGTIKSRLSYARQYLRGVLSRQNREDWR